MKYTAYISDLYKINYKPLIYIALKYNPYFLTKYHNNLETAAVDVLEAHVKSILRNKPTSYFQNELTNSINDKDIEKSLKFATYIYENNIPYVKNPIVIQKLKNYADDKIYNGNNIWDDEDKYIKLVKILNKLRGNKSTL